MRRRLFTTPAKNAAPDQTDSQPPIAKKHAGNAFSKHGRRRVLTTTDFHRTDERRNAYFTAPSFTAADEEPSEAELLKLRRPKIHHQQKETPTKKSVLLLCWPFYPLLLTGVKSARIFPPARRNTLPC